MGQAAENLMGDGKGAGLSVFTSPFKIRNHYYHNGDYNTKCGKNFFLIYL